MDVCSERQQQFMAKLTKRHGDKLDLSMVRYENFEWPVTVRCPSHGVFEIKPRYLMKYNQPCRQCRLERRDSKMMVCSSPHDAVLSAQVSALLNQVFQP